MLKGINDKEFDLLIFEDRDTFILIIKLFHFIDFYLMTVLL